MTAQLPNLKTKNIYDQDFYQWIYTTISQLKERDFDAVDWENLLGELDSLGKQQKQELERRLIIVLEHILKLIYWETEQEYNARGWWGTIVEQRKQIFRLLKNNPSLKPHLSEYFESCYDDARDIVIAKTGLPKNTFPIQPNFTLKAALEENWLTETE
jgi:hypothetical protein